MRDEAGASWSFGVADSSPLVIYIPDKVFLLFFF